MKKWEVMSEEASIVLVGSFNPPIFHPEWLIGKQIIDPWDYASEENNVCLPDLAQMSLPDGRTLSVYLNRFILKSPLASNHLALADLVASIFSILAETPLEKLGMNYASTIRLRDQESWESFGRELAPSAVWENACGYLSDKLVEKDQKQVGLWSLTMNLPRPDGLNGFIRPKVEAVNPRERTLSFSTNNHVELGQTEAPEAMEILATHWQDSLSISNKLIESMMASQLGS